MSRLLLAALLLAACSREPGVGFGSTVVLEYELSSGGEIVESSAGGEPMIVVQGRGDLPPDVEAALVGAKAGEVRIVDVPARAPDPSKIKPVPLAKFGEMAKDLAPGAVVSGTDGGKAAQGRVLKVADGLVTLDFNHPLAGKALTYKLKVLSIRRAD